MNTHQIVDVYKEADNVYLNVTFPAKYSQNQAVLMEYDVTKDVAIINKGSEYYLSIIRFDVPLAEIPIALPPITPNQSNPNLTQLVIGVSYNGINYPQNVIFQTQSIDEIVPVQNKPTAIYTPYYYIYEYEWLIKLINTALLASYNASPLPGLFGGYTPPYFNFNEQTQLIELIIPKFFYTLTSPAIAIPRININYSMLQFLDNFTWVGGVIGPAVINQFNLYLDTTYLTDRNGYALFGTAPTNPPTYYILQQCNFNMQYWNPVKKLLFTCNNIPIRQEFIQSNDTNSTSPALPILTDFTPTLDTADSGRSIAYYYATAQYRLCDILSDSPIRKISLKVYWEDIYGNINPMYIGSYQQANVKMLFLHKSQYKTRLNEK